MTFAIFYFRVTRFTGDNKYIIRGMNLYGAWTPWETFWFVEKPLQD